MTALLLKFSPYLIAATALMGIGGWTGWSLNPWHARYKSLQASDAIERMHGEEAVRSALTAQLAQAQTVTHNNQDAMRILANANAQTAADRDLTVARLHRLEQLLALAAAAKPPASRIVSKNGSGSATTAASDPPGFTPIEGLLVSASVECEQTANQLNALIQEVKAQL